jgi:hypothetical protein
MGADSRNTLVTGQCGSYIHDLGIDNRITCGSQVGRCDSHPNVAAIVRGNPTNTSCNNSTPLT